MQTAGFRGTHLTSTRPFLPPAPPKIIFRTSFLGEYQRLWTRASSRRRDLKRDLATLVLQKCEAVHLQESGLPGWGEAEQGGGQCKGLFWPYRSRIIFLSLFPTYTSILGSPLLVPPSYPATACFPTPPQSLLREEPVPRTKPTPAAPTTLVSEQPSFLRTTVLRVGENSPGRARAGHHHRCNQEKQMHLHLWGGRKCFCSPASSATALLCCSAWKCLALFPTL